MRWTDLRALMVSLESTSNFKRVINPKQAAIAEWSTPQVQLLAALWDQNLRLAYARAGQQAPTGSILDSVLGRTNPSTEASRKAPSARSVSAAQVRERIKELERASSE